MLTLAILDFSSHIRGMSSSWCMQVMCGAECSKHQSAWCYVHISITSAQYGKWLPFAVNHLANQVSGRFLVPKSIDAFYHGPSVRDEAHFVLQQGVVRVLGVSCGRSRIGSHDLKSVSHVFPTGLPPSFFQKIHDHHEIRIR